MLHNLDQERTRVYLDVCCLNRPFDDQTQARIRLESEATLIILAHCEQGRLEWVGSEALTWEIDKTPDPEFAGRGFQLTAYQYGQPQPSLVFKNPITFTVRYSDDDVEGLDEESLTLFYRDGDDWRTDGLTVTRRFTATNEVMARGSHLTEFGLFGQERGYQVYLPLVLRAWFTRGSTAP